MAGCHVMPFTMLSLLALPCCCWHTHWLTHHAAHCSHAVFLFFSFCFLALLHITWNLLIFGWAGEGGRRHFGLWPGGECIGAFTHTHTFLFLSAHTHCTCTTIPLHTVQTVSATCVSTHVFLHCTMLLPHCFLDHLIFLLLSPHPLCVCVCG